MVEILVASKMTITKKWLKKDTQNCKQWLSIIKEFHRMGRLSYKLDMKECENEFEEEKKRKWRT